MIETLSGTKETVNYLGDSTIRLYDNIEAENYPLHWHSSLEIIMPIENIYTVYCNDEEYVLQEGDILIISSGVLHQLTAPSKGRRYIIIADLSQLNSLNEFNTLVGILSPIVHITPNNSPKIVKRLQILINNIVNEYGNASLYRDTVMYTILLSIFTIIGRNHAIEEIFPRTNSSKQMEYSTVFLTVCNYINNHFNENITLEQVADLAGFSKYHFSRIFKQYSDVSFYQYLNKTRIMHATSLLRNPAISINTVSQQCGFTSMSAFIRMFKIQKGCTPSEYKGMYLQRREIQEHK
ncbi:MAG: transcriptional regulator, AraC family [Herbinix sp.]|nr:transcriptional regulator, AraC family [Herbinix sp.]